MKLPSVYAIFHCACIALLQASPAQPEYLQFFDPAKGFKPAQTNLTDIFLQLAGSLESSGSPEPYLRHMQKEEERISAKFEKKTGRKLTGLRPAHMTDEYINHLITNWNLLSPKLQLDALARDAGRCAREGIRGTRDTGTIVVEIFNAHQKQVADQMASKVPRTIGFEQLRAKLAKELEYDKKRVDMAGYEVARRDAISYALIFEGIQSQLYEKIDGRLSPKNAMEVKEIITSILLDLGYMAHSEFELGMMDWSLQ